MIASEKINIRVALERVNTNINKLNNSKDTLENIFNITFSHEDYTIFNSVANNMLKEVSYGQAKSFCEVYGTIIKQKIENKSQKYVGILLDSSPVWVYVFYGLLMYGYVPVLLSTNNDTIEALKIMNELSSTVIITNKVIDNCDFLVINPFEFETNVKICEEKQWADEVIFLSSGTTSDNKIVSYTGKELSNQIRNAGYIIKKYPSIASNYEGYLKQLVVLPFFHIFGFVAVFLWFSFFNTTFVFPSSLTPIKLNEACMIAKPSHIFAVPLFWDTTVRKIESFVKASKIEEKFNKGINLSIKLQKNLGNLGYKMARNVLFKNYYDEIFGKSIQFCIAGGSVISEKTLKVINGLGYPLINGYGSTEIGITSFASPKNIKTRLKPSIGIPFEGIKYDIRDGELYVSSSSSFNKIFVDGKWVSHDEYINTSDSCEFINGEYFIKGRLDEMYIGKNGENYSLAKLEKDFATNYCQDVIVLPNEDNSLSLILSYSMATAEYQIKSDLAKLFKTTNQNFKLINNVFFTKYEFPKANGIKIKRNKVKDTFYRNKDLFVLVTQNYVKDFSDDNLINDQITNDVISVFKKIFNNIEITAHSNFFTDLGGDSLIYFELVANIEETFNIKFNVSQDSLKSPFEFAQYIKEHL